MRNEQQHGKAYFSINYQLKNQTAPDSKPILPINVQLEEYVLASFLVSKEQSTAVLLGSDAGFDRGRLTPQVGMPTEAGHEIARHVWKRGYAHALALVNVNPLGTVAHNVTLDRGYTYSDHFTGLPVSSTKPFLLGP